MTDCEHNWKSYYPIPILNRPRGYSRCGKCGLIRHDKDGHTFRGFREAIKKSWKSLNGEHQ